MRVFLFRVFYRLVLSDDQHCVGYTGGHTLCFQVSVFVFVSSNDHIHQVVQHTMSLLGTLAELQPGLSGVLLSSPGLGPALEFSLLHTPERLVRAKVSSGVIRMVLTLRSTSQVPSQWPSCDVYPFVVEK